MWTGNRSAAKSVGHLIGWPIKNKLTARTAGQILTQRNPPPISSANWLKISLKDLRDWLLLQLRHQPEASIATIGPATRTNMVTWRAEVNAVCAKYPSQSASTTRRR